MSTIKDIQTVKETINYLKGPVNLKKKCCTLGLAEQNFVQSLIVLLIEVSRAERH